MTLFEFYFKLQFSSLNKVKSNNVISTLFEITLFEFYFKVQFSSPYPIM